MLILLFMSVEIDALVHVQWDKMLLAIWIVDIVFLNIIRPSPLVLQTCVSHLNIISWCTISHGKLAESEKWCIGSWSSWFEVDGKYQWFQRKRRLQPDCFVWALPLGHNWSASYWANIEESDEALFDMFAYIVERGTSGRK